MRCRRKLIESGETKIPRTCQECGLFGVCPHYPYTPNPTPEQQIQTLETRVEELERALNGVRELMGEEHSYWACYPAQGPHNAVLRDYTKAWCKLIDRLIEGETFEEFTLVDEVDKYFKKEQHR